MRAHSTVTRIKKTTISTQPLRNEIHLQGTNRRWAHVRLVTRTFTLLELLAAIAVFSILSILLFQTLHGVEKFWSTTERRLKVLENARIVFDVIEEDLRGIVARDLPGDEIYVDAAGVGVRDFAFVTNTRQSSSSNSTLYEVGYELSDKKLVRWETGDIDGAKWNFVNTDPLIWAADSSWGSYDTLIDGVKSFQFAFYKATATSPFYAAYDAVSDSPVVPSFAVVTMTLIHPVTVDLSVIEQNKTKQTFTNRFDLNRY